MLREYEYVLPKVNIAVDCAIAFAAIFVAHFLRTLLSIYIAPQWIGPAGLADYSSRLYLLTIIVPVLTVSVLAYNGYYKSQRLKLHITSLVRTVAVSSVEIAVILMALVYVLWRGDSISRPFIVLVPSVLFVFLSAKTYLMRKFLMKARESGYNFRRVVLIGSGEPLSRFIDNLLSHPIWGFHIEGIITDCADEFDASSPGGPVHVHGHPLIGDLSTAKDALMNREVDEVVLVPYEVTLKKLAPVMQLCEEMGVRTHLPLTYFEAQMARPVIDYFDEMPVISYWPTRDIGPGLVFKYAFDRIFAALLLALLSPVLLAILLAVKLTSMQGERPIFRQTRCGLNNRRFTLLKFRTMRADAELQSGQLEHLNELDGPVFKMEQDPRITKLGRVLRRFSLDELPQLWNVVRGDMSLVGPRPPLPSEVEKYDVWHRRRLSMKPGITCLWQVSGRNRLPFETWMKLDLQYIDNWSLSLDFKILAHTIVAVMTGHGAM